MGDSKRVYGVSHDLATLEGPLLAFLTCQGARITQLDELLAAVGVDPAVRLAAPWYSGAPPAIPMRARASVITASAERLRAAFLAHEIEFLGLVADVMPEQRYNAALGAGNKAEVLFAAGSGLFDRLAAGRRAGEAMNAVFDRQGGRHFYGPVLQRRWPEAFACPLGESPIRSDYRLHFPGGPAFVRFEVEADGSSPQVGLASMLAKCLREMFMSLFNTHFASVCPGVTPTAGYVEDGRRWLIETRAARTLAGVPDSDLVRLR